MRPSGIRIMCGPPTRRPRSFKLAFACFAQFPGARLAVAAKQAKASLIGQKKEGRFVWMPIVEQIWHQRIELPSILAGVKPNEFFAAGSVADAVSGFLVPGGSP